MTGLLLGADAGGSHTTAIVVDEDGVIVGKAVGAPGAVRQGGEAQAAANIIATCRAALADLGRVDALVVGAAGVADEGRRAGLLAALEQAVLAERVAVVTDAELALTAAFGDGPGIVLLAGTGSIAWARRPDGTMVREGGLGPTMGDPGSGHDLGRHALLAVAQALEGRGPTTLLTARLAQHAGVAATALSGWAARAPVEDIAALAPVVLDASADGDEVAAGIVESGAVALARHVAVLAPQLGLMTPVPLALGGGLLTGRIDYERRVLDRVAEQCPGVEPADAPIREPVIGAIRIAQRL